MLNIRFGGIAAALLLALTACGGGGGGSGSTGVGPQAPGDGMSDRDILLADPEGNRQAIEDASAPTPRFGSVTQSTNSDSDGVTTDRARANLEGSKLTVMVTRGDDSSFTFNTADDRFSQETSTSEVSGLEFTHWGFVKQTGAGARTETTLAYAAHTSTGDDATDWLAGGYWLQLHGDIGVGRIDRIEAGAFVDGPELRTSPTLPTIGTAAYNGEARGFYGTVYGTDDPNVPQGSVEVGLYEGKVALTADFQDAIVSGEIDEITLDYRLTEAGSGDVFTGQIESEYTLTLGDAPIAANGQFASKDITLAHPDLTITSSGSWGGRFSSEADADGNPRVVAGTHGGTGTTPEGSKASFIGAFYGVTDRHAADR